MSNAPNTRRSSETYQRLAAEHRDGLVRYHTPR